MNQTLNQSSAAVIVRGHPKGKLGFSDGINWKLTYLLVCLFIYLFIILFIV